MILIAMMRTHFPAMTLPMRTSMEPGVRVRWLATEMEDVELGWLMVPKLEVSEPLVSCSCDHRRPALDLLTFVPKLGTNIQLLLWYSNKCLSKPGT